MHRSPARPYLLYAMFALPALASAQTPPLDAAKTRVQLVAYDAKLPGEIALGDAQGEVVGVGGGFVDRSTGIRGLGFPRLWASVTKQVTAVLVMQEVERLTLALDGTLDAYLPDFSGPNGNRITIRQLLQHRSGLPNPDDSAPDVYGQPSFYSETGAGIGDAARARGYCAGTPKRQPGLEFEYNNCDYLVLGAILERVTGRSYAQLIEERIGGGGPTRIRDLRMMEDGTVPAGVVTRGQLGGDSLHAPLNVATFGAAGALTGSAESLIRFNSALLDNTLLTPASRAILWHGDPQLGYQALGVWSFSTALAGCAGPVALIERRGDVAGMQVRNVIAPDLGRSIAVFTDDGKVDFGEVWQGKGLTHDLLSAAFCPAAGASR